MSNEITTVQSKNGYLNDIMVIDTDTIQVFDREEYDLFNEKDFKKYIDNVEKCVRTSFEYKEFILYLRNYMDMNKCALFKNVTNIESTKIKIELHHHPYTLFDMSLIVYNKRSSYGEPLDVELVAKEVMYLHYFLYVGLVPLSKTVHELFHNQILFIPLNIVLGKYLEFENQYGEFIPPEIKDKINTYSSLTDTYNSEINKRILEVAPIYLQIDDGDIGTYKLPKLQDVLSLVGERLEQIQDRNPKGILLDPYYVDPTKSNEPVNENTQLFDEDGMIVPFVILD